MAKVKEIAIKTTIEIPVTPSTPVRRDLYVGLSLWKSEDIGENWDVKSRIEELFDEVSLNGELYAIVSGFIE